MKVVLGPGIVAGLVLVCALSATGQTLGNNSANRSGPLPTKPTVSPRPDDTPNKSTYQYDFISQKHVWSNKPLHATATKICTTMKDHAFSETAYAINNQEDWNSCLDTQIRSIGYLRWLQNTGFKPTRKNRRRAQQYLKQKYTMGPWGSYSFAQLKDAVQSTSAQHP
jgi:hypothetical protein